MPLNNKKNKTICYHHSQVYIWWLSIRSDDDVCVLQLIYEHGCVDRSVIGEELQEDQYTGAILLSRFEKSWSIGTENRYDGTLPGCSRWPRLLWVPHPTLGARTTLAATALTTVGSSGELFRFFFRRESGFSCSRANTAHSKLANGLRPVGYPHLV